MKHFTAILALVATILAGCGPGAMGDRDEAFENAATESDTGSDEHDGGRLRLVEIGCVDGVCAGRWDGGQLWSLVFDSAEVAASPEIPAPWPCTNDMDVDVCVEVDDQGHVGCFWYQHGWAVAVAPSCAVNGSLWIDVGNGMRSSAS